MRSIKLLLCFMLVLSAFAPVAVHSNDSTRVATIIEKEGNVFIKRAGGNREFTALVGMGLTQGDFIRTERRANVTLRISEGKEITIGENTQILVSELRAHQKGEKSKIRIWAGSIWSKVRSLVNADDEFEVETPTSIMGVRGTLYLVIIDPITGRERVYVLDGTVEVKENKEQNRRIPTDTATSSSRVEGGQQLERSPNQQVLQPQIIDAQTLVEEIGPDLMATIIKDALEEAEEAGRKAEEKEKEFFETQNPDSLREATKQAGRELIIYYSLSQIVKSVRQSPSSQDIVQSIEERQMNIEQIETQVSDRLKQAFQTTERIEQEALTEGITEQEIDELIPVRPQPEDEPPPPEQPLVEQPPVEEPPSEVEPGEGEPNEGEPGGVEPGEGEPNEVEPIYTVSLKKNDNYLSVIANNVSIPVYGVQIHLDVGPLTDSDIYYDLSQLELFEEYEEVHFLQVLEHQGYNNELIFAQLLYDAEEGVSFEGDRIIFNLGIYSLESVEISILQIKFYDINGHEIPDVIWSEEAINYEPMQSSVN